MVDSSGSGDALRASVGAIEFKNPILGASGAFGNGVEYSDFLDLDQLGGFVTKSVTAKATKGNPPPRVAETPGGMLNAIGLMNEGVDAFCRNILPKLAGIKCKVIANVAGHAREDYLAVAERLDCEPRVDGLELNVSCPNVKAGGMAFGVDAALCASVVKDVRARTKKPLWVKLSPNVTDITSIAKGAEEAGADALVVANTLLGMMVDVEKRKPILANVTGGLSGPAVLPVALRLVWQVSKAVKIPVVGVGGISKVEDIVAMLLCGARAVEIGTMNFVEPAITARLREDLSDWLAKHGETVSGLVGQLKTA